MLPQEWSCAATPLPAFTSCLALKGCTSKWLDSGCDCPCGPGRGAAWGDFESQNARKHCRPHCCSVCQPVQGPCCGHPCLTCLRKFRVCWAVVFAMMVWLLPGLGWRERDKLDTTCAFRSVMLTFSSATVTRASPSTASMRGDTTCERQQ